MLLWGRRYCQCALLLRRRLIGTREKHLIPVASKRYEGGLTSNQDIDQPWLPATAPRMVIVLSARSIQCDRCNRSKAASG